MALPNIDVPSIVFGTSFVCAEGNRGVCLGEADTDAGTTINITDLTTLVEYFFAAGNTLPDCW